MDRKTDEKRSRLETALGEGMAQLHLDARRPGVLVPKQFLDEHHLVLNVSYRFDPPDLSVNDWGVRETLSFSGSRFKVAVPWSAIYAIASHVTREFWMFPNEMPAELLAGMAEKAEGLPGAPEPLTPKGPRAILREVATAPLEEPEVPGAAVPSVPAVPSVASLASVAPPPPDTAPAAPQAEAPPAPRRSHLRVVK